MSDDAPASPGTTGLPETTALPGTPALLESLSPAMLRLAEELSRTMFCAKDVSGRYVAVNQAFVDRTNERSRRTVVGRTAHDLFEPHLADHYVAQDRQVLETGRPLRRELELIVRPGGVPGWYLTSKEPVRVDDVVVGLVSVSEDLRTHDPADVAVASLSRVMTLVAERAHEGLSVTELAEVAGCSTSTLDRRMRKVLGLSPQQYLLRARIDRAAHLLTTTSMPIADVATAAGFYDQAVLTRTFGRLTGETPAQFRRRETRAPSGSDDRHPDAASAT